jgi:glycine betaine/choline ABC-type transport system substrate-binding protein
VGLWYTTVDKEFSLANTETVIDLYKAEYIGSGTFIIKKPKRSAKKRRQSKLRGLKRGMRK